MCDVQKPKYWAWLQSLSTDTGWGLYCAEFSLVHSIRNCWYLPAQKRTFKYFRMDVESWAQNYSKPTRFQNICLARLTHSTFLVCAFTQCPFHRILQRIFTDWTCVNRLFNQSLQQEQFTAADWINPSVIMIILSIFIHTYILFFLANVFFSNCIIRASWSVIQQLIVIWIAYYLIS